MGAPGGKTGELTMGEPPPDFLTTIPGLGASDTAQQWSYPARLNLAQQTNVEQEKQFADFGLVDANVDRAPPSKVDPAPATGQGQQESGCCVACLECFECIFTCFACCFEVFSD